MIDCVIKNLDQDDKKRSDTGSELDPRLIGVFISVYWRSPIHIVAVNYSRGRGGCDRTLLCVMDAEQLGHLKSSNPEEACPEEKDGVEFKSTLQFGNK